MAAHEISPRPALAAHGLTDVGRRRATNEDSFAVLPDARLFMVADGMGGAAAGEVASRTTIEHVRAAFEDPAAGPRSGKRLRSDARARRLVASVQQANRILHEEALQDRRLAGMGTTFAGLLLGDHRAVIAHVGDSRVYRLRGGGLEQMTEDHTLVSDYLRIGILHPSQVGSFAYRNVITRAVGVRESVDVDVQIVELRPGDVFLICSDGLHGEISDGEIASVLRAHRDPERAAARLVEHANDAGGSDNITAVVVRFGFAPR